MIPYGRNGRVSGLYLAEKLLQDRRVPLSGDDLVTTEKGNELKRLPRAAEATGVRDPEADEALPYLTDQLLLLLYFAEEDPALVIRMTAEKDAAEYAGTEENGKDAVCRGMRCLIFLADGTLQFTPVSGRLFVRMSDRLSRTEGAEDFVRALIACLSRFADEEMPETVFMAGKQPEPVSQEAAAEQRPELPPSRRETLDSLNRLFGSLNERTEEAHENASEALRFTEGRRFTGPDYSFRIPDGFTLVEHADGYPFILWKPNPENPGEWEASSLLLMPADTVRAEKTAKKQLFFREDGSSAVFLFELPSGTRIRRFRLEIRAYTAEKKEAFFRTAVRLFERFEARED